MNNHVKVVVGSTNPVKVNAVRVVFEKYYPGCQVLGVGAASGVSGQPMTEEETIRGARNRARAVLTGSDFGVGIEGGVCEIEGKLFECAWVAVVKVKNEKLKVKDDGNEDGYVEGLGGGLYFELPEKIASRIRDGEELGPVMEEIMQYDVKRSEGAIGVFSKGKLSRQQAYEQIVTTAVLKFVSPEWFE